MITKVRFDPSGSCIASCSADKKIKIFDARSQRLLQHYNAHTEGVNSVNFHPTGNYLISSSQDSTVKIWDLRQGTILYTLYGHEGASTAGCFSTYGDFFATGGKDSVVQVWKSNFDTPRGERIEGLWDKKPTGSRRVTKFNDQAPQAKTVTKANDEQIEELNEKPEVEADQESVQSDIQEEPRKTLSSDEIPQELGGALDKIVFQLDLLSKTVFALEQRLSVSEDKMTEVIDHIKDCDTKGNKRMVSTSAVIQTSTMINKMDPITLSNTLQQNQQKLDGVKVAPLENVTEDFMRETNQFVQI